MPVDAPDDDGATGDTSRQRRSWLSSAKPSDVQFDPSTGGFTSARNLDAADDGNDEGAGNDHYDDEEEESRLEPTPEEGEAAETTEDDEYEDDGVGHFDVSMGGHLKDTNVFTVEVLSNKTMSIIMICYYIAFAVLMTYTFTRYIRTSSSSQVAILTDGGTVCNPQPDGTCDSAGVVITGSEAILLANTIAVSSGLNLTNWNGNGAVPGTPPFNALDVDPNSFMVTKDVLDEDANPQLAYKWDDVVGALWAGHSGGWDSDSKISRSYQSAEFTFTFTRLDGTAWPSNAADGDLQFILQTFACLRGHKCSSIGDFRSQFLYDEDTNRPEELKATTILNGNVLTASVNIPNTMVLPDVVQSNGWRYVWTTDPGGAVTACAEGENCRLEIKVLGEPSRRVSRVSIELTSLVLYASFFIYWLWTCCKRLGTDLNKWHIENKWLIILGTGFLMYNGFLWVSLQVRTLYSNFTFRESLWAASFILTMLGQNLQIFAFACFADIPRRYVVSPFKFYFYKALFCLIFWMSQFVYTMYQFPTASGRDEPGNDITLGGLGFVTAPETWSTKDKRVLTAFMIIWLVCGYFAIGYYFWRCHKTKKVLSTLPYNMTRPLQLAFRFFRWATLVWIVVLLFGMILGIVVSSQRTSNYNAVGKGGLDATVVVLNEMDNFQWHQNPATVLFGLVLTVVYQIFFLPPREKYKVKKSHHVNEEESLEARDAEKTKGKFLMVLDRARLLCTCSRETYLPFDDEERSKFTGIPLEEVGEMRRNAGAAPSEYDVDVTEATSSPSNTGGEVEVELPEAPSKTLPVHDTVREYVQRANASHDQKGRTPPEQKLERVDSWLPAETFSKKGDPPTELYARYAGESHCTFGNAPPGSTYAMGCQLIKRIKEPPYADMHNSRALLFRHEPSGDLIVAFRGTKTTTQIKTDLMTQKVYVSLDTFLTITGRGKRASKEFEGILPEDLEERMREGTAGKIAILDLLHRDNEEQVPEFLKGRCKAGDDIRGVAHLHFGFWSSYCRLRTQVHAAVFEELVANPGRLLVCGHSLGGAQATACAYDMSRWIIPSVKKELLTTQGRRAADKISMCLYTYGAPRLGGPKFRKAFDKAVPDCQRILNDGDIVTTTPPQWLGFLHVGEEIVLDYTGAMIINPTLIEKKFANKSRTSGNAHRLPNYTRAIKRAYHPTMPIEKLLQMMRDAYGYGMKGKVKEKDMWESSHHREEN